jgi:diguanylate cyclase (GGDEF)-like protein/putative nucleotidyltransferase with HDIG domain
MPEERPADFAALPRQAQLLISTTVFAGVAAATAATAANPGADVDLPLLLVGILLCGGASLFEVFAPGHYSLQPNFAFFFWGAVMLPPWAIAVLAVCCFVPGWVANRLAWFKVAFNIGNYLIAGLAAHAVVSAADVFVGGAAPEPSAVAALAVAAVVFTFVNHLLIVFVASFASGSPLQSALHQLADGLPLDVPLATTGACLAVLWDAGPAIALLALGPIALVYRALLVPQLEHRARTDPKTGLYNFAHFSAQMEESVEAAGRHGGTLAVIVVDLDHLREINNRFGHLVGDRVILAAADALASTGEPGAIAARFGGEEFCLLLPGASLEQARRCAETARERVAAMRFREDDRREGAAAAVTLSAGIACFPDHGETPEALLKAADRAVYEAKAAGRNRVRTALSAASRAALDLTNADLPADPPLKLLTPPGPDALAEVPEENARREPSSATDEHPYRSTEVAPDAPAPVVATRRFLPAYAGLVAGAAALAAVLSDTGAITRSTDLLLVLVVAVVVLDLVDLDLFGRGRVSPGAVPSLALAFYFGPAGPVAAEALVWVVRVARGEPLIKASFNFGALGLSGAVAAGVLSLAGSAEGGALVAAGALAGLTYYAANASLVAGVWALDEGVAPVAAWRERFAWCWPHHAVFGALAGTFLVAYDEVGDLAFALVGLPVAMLWLAQKQYLDHTRTSVAELRERHEEATTANTRLRRLLEDKHFLLQQVHRSYLATITSLARTIEAKDPYTGGHTERVAEVALLLARELGFDETEQRAIGVGAVIHDIGKVGIPDDILLKPGRLSLEELEIIRKHPEISTYILAELELPSMVKEMVRHHHERIDGSGYPDGLAGEEIPLAARVLAVADALDAMTTDRPYRHAQRLEKARAEIAAQTGLQFCPRVVAALEASFESDPAFWRGFEHRCAAQGEPGASVAV